MSDPTLFNDNTNSEAPAADPQQTAPTSSAYDTMLQGIQTTDGRQKYATISDALNSIPHKDQHISTLESENSVLREELAVAKAAAEAATIVAPSNTGTGSTPTAEPNTVIDVEGLSEQVFKKVSAEMTAQEQAAVRHQRIVEFKNKFTESYGEKAADIYTQKLAESGLSEKILLDAEVASPGAAWKFLGLEKPTTVEAPTVLQSSRNSTGSQPVVADTAPRFRPTNQSRPGEKYAAQRAETLKRLGVTLD